MRPKTLLVNPPLWNAYAPHLAVPLLLGVLRERGWPARGLDLSIETMDFVLSPTGLDAIGERLEERARRGGGERRRVERALLLHEGTRDRIEPAKAVLRSVTKLDDPDAFARAQATMRNAMWCVSAAFDGLEFDLAANDLYYSARSSSAVLRATTDPDRNVYRWALDRMGVEPLVDDVDLGMVGISVSADTQLVAALTFARLVRERRPDVHVVLGGNFTTRVVTRWRQPHAFFELVDSFVLYEGEEALPQLCESSFEGGTRAVPGLVTCDGDTLVSTPPEAVALDRLPPPDYDDSPLGKYFAPGPILPTYASRSCAWDCAFCSIPFASNKFRARSGVRVADEMGWLAERYGTRYFYLVDEILTLKSLRDVADELNARGADFNWYGETRFFNGWTPDLAERLHRSGCRRLSFGLESYNQRVLDRMRKGTRVEWIDRNIDALLGAGIPLHLFCILGFPGETEDEMRRTISFARDACARAREDYGVEHTTWAAAPFILDLHSPVGQYPDEFGVTLVPPPAGEDLALTVDYRVEHGAGQDASWRLMREVSRAVGGAPGRDTFWFDLPVRRHIEERLFLRACTGAAPEQELRRPAAVYRPDPARAIAAAPDTTFRRFRSWAAGGGAEPALLVYAHAADAVFRLPYLSPRQDQLFRRSSAIGEKARRLSAAASLPLGSALDLVTAMERYGALTGPESPWTELAPELATFRQEPGVEASFDPRSGRGTLRAEATGRVLSVGTQGFGAFLLCGEGGCTPGDPRAARLGVDEPALLRLLTELQAHGFVYAQDEVGPRERAAGELERRELVPR